MSNFNSGNNNSGTVRVRGWVRVAIPALLLALATYFALDYFNSKPKTADNDSPQTTTSDDQLWQNVEKAGVLRVGVEPDAAPMNFLEGSTRKGFEYELISAVAKEMGISRVEVNDAFNYDDLPAEAQKGTFDVFMGGYVPDPDIENTIWSDSYLDFGLCLIVPKGSAIENTRQLKGKRVAYYNGDNAAKEWAEKNLPGATLVEGPEDTEDVRWMEVLNKGEVEAIIYDYPFASEELKEFETLKIVQLNLNESKYAVGIPGKKNFEFLAKINSALKKVQDSPLYAQLVKKYLRSEQVETAKVKETATQRIYVIKVGDTLGAIAERELGSSSRWTEIWELNKVRLPNPHLIFENDRILLPKQ